VSRRRARCAATGHVDGADAARGRRPGGQPVRYLSQCQGRQDCSYNSPPGGSTCRCRGPEQRCLLLSAATAAHGGYAACEPFSELPSNWWTAAGLVNARAAAHDTAPIVRGAKRLGQSALRSYCRSRLRRAHHPNEMISAVSPGPPGGAGPPAGSGGYTSPPLLGSVDLHVPGVQVDDRLPRVRGTPPESECGRDGLVTSPASPPHR